MDPSGEAVRERAYRIWEAEGRPHGRELAHWLQAEREIAEPQESAAESPIRARPTDGASKKRIAPRKPRAKN